MSRPNRHSRRPATLAAALVGAGVAVFPPGCRSGEPAPTGRRVTVQAESPAEARAADGSIFDAPAEQPAPTVEVVRPPEPTRRAVERPMPDLAQARPVVAGTLPLAYLTQGTRSVRVVDETTGQTLAATPASGGDVVAVSRSGGVSVGGVTLAPGPLPDDHRYAVYADAGVGAGAFRSQSIRPAAPGVARPADTGGRAAPDDVPPALPLFRDPPPAPTPSP